MPGKKTARILKNCDYPTFYRVVHHFSEEVLIQINVIQLKAEVLLRLLHGTVDETLSDPANLRELRDLADKLVAYSHILNQDVRDFFWGEGWENLPPSITVYEANAGRWQPYDSRVWDEFYGAFVKFMMPRVEAIEDAVQRINTFADHGGMLVREDGWVKEWKIADRHPLDACQRLKSLLNPVGFETAMYGKR
jgi:hypothetical protein